MSLEDLERKINELENTVIELSETLIATATEHNKLEEKHKGLNIKFSSFAKAVLKNSDKEFSRKVFKEYQKSMFSKDAE